MALFAPRSTKQSDKKLLNKVNSTTSVFMSRSKSGGKGLSERIASAEIEVNRYFSKFKDDFIIIRDEETLKNYFNNVIKDGIIAIDTETNGLDTFNGILAGICIYSPSNKAAYIPVHHVSYITGEEVQNQLKEDIIKTYFSLIDKYNIKVIMHNAAFDLKVFANMLGMRLPCYWDTLIASNLLNENEPHGLKVLHDKYCGDNTGVYSINNLFEGIVFTHVPLKLGYLYAARDAKMTYELYEYQSKWLSENPPEGYEDLKSCYDVMMNIEMPLVPVILDTELRGIGLDPSTCDKLKQDYNSKLEDCTNRFNSIVEPLKDTVLAYIRSHSTLNSKCKLEWPINFDSPLQISELLYKVLMVDSSKGTGTGLADLQEISEKTNNQVVKDIIKVLLEYRKLQKLLTTYIEKLPEVVNPKTGKIHCNFNQYGTVTGRMSSNSPNLQNIPSKNKDIRKMFCADDGYCLIGCDFSQQEPRLLAHMSGDEQLIHAYVTGVDLYAHIGSLALHIPYEQCLEKNPDGTVNPEGKKRRDKMKAIVLALMYGKGPKALAEDLKITLVEAQDLMNSVFSEFPKIKKFIDESQNFARCNGYVKTLWGRKRRLPDMMLDKYEFTYANGVGNDFDPLGDFSQPVELNQEVKPELKQKWTRLLDTCYGWKRKQMLVQQALQEDGLKIKENGMKIADAERQCVNSRIQGSAGDMVKRASILCYNDKRLQERDCHILIWVHDEIIATAPIKYAQECAKFIVENMCKSADIVCVPMKVDTEITKVWYGPEIDFSKIENKQESINNANNS